MKFKLDAADLIAALDVVSIVPPRPITPQGGTGFLFVVGKDREGKDTCKVYSRDSQHVAMAAFPLSDVEGEGAFIYPANYVEAFRFLDGKITFETEQTDDKYVVKYTADSGAAAERTSYDPRLMATCDKDLDAATDERVYPVGLLRESIELARPFLAKPNETRVEEHFKTLQVFDKSNEAWAKGDGHMFAANGVQAFYFYAEAFEGKGLAVHGQHIPLLCAFLAKSDGQVVFKTGQNMTFAIDPKGRALGWAHHMKTHGKFSYYPLNRDKFVLQCAKGPLMKALQYTRTELDAKRDKIRIVFERDKTSTELGVLRFEVSEGTGKAKSVDLLVKIPAESPIDRDLTINVNIDHLIELVAGTKSNEPSIRIAVLPPDGSRTKEAAMFRTIDEFYVDAAGKVMIGGAEGKPAGSFLCRVTRFMPSKD